MGESPPIGFVRRPKSGKVYCRTCGAGGWEGGSWMDGCRFGHAPCPRCGVLTTLLSTGKPRTHATCPKATNLERERDEAELNGSMDRGEGMP